MSEDIPGTIPHNNLEYGTHNWYSWICLKYKGFVVFFIIKLSFKTFMFSTSNSLSLVANAIMHHATYSLRHISVCRCQSNSTLPP